MVLVKFNYFIFCRSSIASIGLIDIGHATMPGRDNLYSQGDGPPRPQPSGRFRYPSNRQLALAAKSDIEEVTRQSLEAKIVKKDMPREKLKTSRDATS